MASSPMCCVGSWMLPHNTVPATSAPPVAPAPKVLSQAHAVRVGAGAGGPLERTGGVSNTSRAALSTMSAVSRVTPPA